MYIYIYTCLYDDIDTSGPHNKSNTCMEYVYVYNCIYTYTYLNMFEDMQTRAYVSMCS